MRNVRGTRHSLPNTRTLTAIAQDPSIKFRGKILTTELTIPAEDLLPGPCGYRVNVIDYDSTTNTLYDPMTYGEQDSRGKYVDPFAYKPNGQASTARKARHDRSLIENPKFHAQHVYAIAMRTLAQFEFALGRRCAWGSDGHQIHIAPHAFADANAFYSRLDRGIFFGYFAGADGKVVYTCLAHDVVAHETTHALLDGLRWRYMEQSMPEQAGFHEGFADIVALLSVFSLPDVVDAGLDLASGGRGHLISSSLLEADALKNSVLFGLAKQMGRVPASRTCRRSAIRNSPSRTGAANSWSRRSSTAFSTSGWRASARSGRSQTARRIAASSGTRALKPPVICSRWRSAPSIIVRRPTSRFRTICRLC